MEKAQNKSEKTKEKHLKMTKAETIDAVYIGQFIQKRINKLNNRVKGGNTFICDKRKDRLDLEKS